MLRLQDSHLGTFSLLCVRSSNLVTKLVQSPLSENCPSILESFILDTNRIETHLSLNTTQSQGTTASGRTLFISLAAKHLLAFAAIPFSVLEAYKTPHPRRLATFLQGFDLSILACDTDALPLMPSKTIATINSTGRQAASFIRTASAVGWHVRAQIRNRDGLVFEELSALPNVEFVEGDITGPDRNRILARLFTGAKIAFINTTHWGDEVAIGKACADAAKRAGVNHYVYSSMPDHSTFGEDWRALPMWASKFTIENYVRQIGIPATFVYTGIYNNNFTSLPYPLFQMELQADGSFVWQAPFHPDDPLPWLDAEHDVGPALLQIFKMGPSHWKGQRYVS